MDVIGISGLYPVGKKTIFGRPVFAGLAPIRDRLAILSHKWNRPVAFLEVGVRSAQTCSTMPWDWTHKELPYDGREQADYYEAVLKTFYRESWFCGFAWWDWPARLLSAKAGRRRSNFLLLWQKPAGKRSCELDAREWKKSN